MCLPEKSKCFRLLLLLEEILVSTSVSSCFMVEISLYGPTKTPFFFDSAKLLCKMCKILSAWGQMFLLKKLGITFACVFKTCVVMLQSVRNKASVDAGLQRWLWWRKSDVYSHAGETQSTCSFPRLCCTVMALQNRCVCFCVGGCVRVRHMKDTCPWWTGKEPCALRALGLLLPTGESISCPQLFAHICRTRTQHPLPTSMQCHLCCHRLSHLSIIAEWCIVKCTGQGRCQLWW